MAIDIQCMDVVVTRCIHIHVHIVCVYELMIKQIYMHAYNLCPPGILFHLLHVCMFSPVVQSWQWWMRTVF